MPSLKAISGVTTTGSTVLTGLDHLPDDILLWRSIMQWMGGIGIIGMAVAILPFLRIGGMRLICHRIVRMERESRCPRTSHPGPQPGTDLSGLDARLRAHLLAAGDEFLSGAESRVDYSIDRRLFHFRQLHGAV